MIRNDRIPRPRAQVYGTLYGCGDDSDTTYLMRQRGERIERSFAHLYVDGAGCGAPICRPLRTSWTTATDSCAVGANLGAGMLHLIGIGHAARRLQRSRVADCSCVV